jgi:flagellar biosynthesis/type III secretory pathway chaperone
LDLFETVLQEETESLSRGKKKVLMFGHTQKAPVVQSLCTLKRRSIEIGIEYTTFRCIERTMLFARRGKEKYDLQPPFFSS